MKLINLMPHNIRLGGLTKFSLVRYGCMYVCTCTWGFGLPKELILTQVKHTLHPARCHCILHPAPEWTQVQCTASARIIGV